MPSPSSLWIAVVQILLSVNSMLDGCEITETKEIGACEVLRAQELTHTHTQNSVNPGLIYPGLLVTGCSPNGDHLILKWYPSN